MTETVDHGEEKVALWPCIYLGMRIHRAYGPAMRLHRAYRPAMRPIGHSDQMYAVALKALHIFSDGNSWSIHTHDPMASQALRVFSDENSSGIVPMYIILAGKAATAWIGGRCVL